MNKGNKKKVLGWELEMGWGWGRNRTDASQAKWSSLGGDGWCFHAYEKHDVEKGRRTRFILLCLGPGQPSRYLLPLIRNQI